VRARVQVQGDVVFVGYGVNAPELKWNDHAGVDVKGMARAMARAGM
jgi:hypothetical protein